MDEDTFKDDIIGETAITMETLCKNYGSSNYYQIFNPKKGNTGTIQLITKYNPPHNQGEIDKSQGWDKQGKFELVKKK